MSCLKFQMLPVCQIFYCTLTVSLKKMLHRVVKLKWKMLLLLFKLSTMHVVLLPSALNYCVIEDTLFVVV